MMTRDTCGVTCSENCLMSSPDWGLISLTCSNRVLCRELLDYHISRLRALTDLWFWVAFWTVVKYSSELLREFCITFADSEAPQQCFNKAGPQACIIWKKELCARIINMIQSTNSDLSHFLFGCRKALVCFFLSSLKIHTLKIQKKKEKKRNLIFEYSY